MIQILSEASIGYFLAVVATVLSLRFRIATVLSVVRLPEPHDDMETEAFIDQANKHILLGAVSQQMVTPAPCSVTVVR
jgi:hypothetical protein